MSLERIGHELDARAYWKDMGASYVEHISGAYHQERQRMIDALLNPITMERRIVVDFGCGDGVHVEALSKRGARMIGIDPDDQLLKIAGDRVEERQDGGVKLWKGGVERLEDIESDSVDSVISLNVLAYLTDEEESRFYREAYRMLRAGGHLVVTHSNELFDLFTLNSFTVSFFQKYFQTDPSSLLSHANRPERPSYNIRENPLVYKHKLARYGLEEEAQEFANFHEVPPLLMDPEKVQHPESRSYVDLRTWPDDERWRLAFQCSMFGSRAAKR